MNPFIGTQDYGNTFPGAAMPFGMVQLSPDNGGQAGYDHDNTRIDGFSHTHLSGVGCGALGEVRVMPTTGAVGSDRPARFGSPLPHDTRRRGPATTASTSPSTAIRAELTATTRTGWHRYTFPSTGQANVLFDVGRANMPVYSSAVDVTSDRTLEGSVEAGGFCGAQDRHRVFFSARFDRAVRGDRDVAARAPRCPGGRRSRERARVATAPGSRSTRPRAAPSGCRSGISYAEPRRRAAQPGGGGRRARASTRVVDAAAARWSVDARAGTGRRRAASTGSVAFTTALYHAFLHPNVIADVNGAYPGADGGVHVASGHTPMGNFSLWDTFRTQNQLLELLAPDVARDVALSILADARGGGWLPRWSLAGAETNIMTGDPVTPFLVENWSAGLLAGHEREAYRALRANALGAHRRLACRSAGAPATVVRPSRLHRERAEAAPSKGGRQRLRTPGFGDARVRRRGRARSRSWRGRWATAATPGCSTRRARGYRTLWDRRLRLFSPRRPTGAGSTPYDPRTGAGQFHEGGAYQYQWLVPQDPAGLVRLLGGRRAAARRLDAFFAYASCCATRSPPPARRWVEHPYEYYGAVTYNPNNEPDLHAPYLYAWTGQPWKTATVVRAAETLFTNGPEGHDRQRRPRHDVGLVRAQLAGPVSRR